MQQHEILPAKGEDNDLFGLLDCLNDNRYQKAADADVYE
jgi:hypothetical protein